MPLSPYGYGIGIAPEHLEQIFEPFVRINDKTKGTGLGLSIAREIVELHGGGIRCHQRTRQRQLLFGDTQVDAGSGLSEE
jgi:signal transduction histidine kinase